jgi:hypothetical protein
MSTEEPIMREILDSLVERGDMISYTVDDTSKIEATLSEKGGEFIEFMNEFFSSFTEDELEMSDLHVAAEVYRSIRTQPLNAS